MAQPPDPEEVAATEARNQRLAEQRRAAAAQQELEAAEYAELQQSVFAIENEHQADPLWLLTDGELDQVLVYYCGECHVQPDVPTQTDDCGVCYLDDMDELISTGKVIPGDAEASRLVQRMRRGEMPPVQSDSPAVPESTIDLIADFINALPARPLPAQ
jgi:hypothetical protein